MDKAYVPYLPDEMMQAIQRRGTVRSDKPDNVVQHWNAYDQGDIQDMYVGMGLGNPPNLAWVQPAMDVPKMARMAERAKATTFVDDKAYIMRSIQPLQAPEQPPATSPLDPRLYPFPRLSEGTNRRNHYAPRLETLVEEDDVKPVAGAVASSSSSSSLFVVTKDDVIKFLSLVCALLIAFILYLVARK